MIALVIILILLAAIMFIPVGVQASYYEGRLAASAKVWFYKLRLYPPKTKKSKPEEAAPTEADSDKPKKQIRLPDFTLNEWLETAKIVLRALRRFKHGLYFEFICLHAVISADDPYDAVTRYNAVNGFVGSAIPFFESAFRVIKKDIHIGLDVNGGESSAEFELTVSIRVGTVIAAALAAGFAILKIFIKNWIRSIRERVARNGKQQTERNDAVDNEQHQGSC